MKLFKKLQFLSEFKYTPVFSLKFVNVILVLQVFIVSFIQSRGKESIASDVFRAWLISGLLILPFILGLVYCARKILVDRFEENIPINLIIRFGFLIGFLKGFMTQYVVNTFHIGDPFPIDEMIIRGFTSAGLAVSLAFSLSLKASLQKDFHAFLKKEKDNDEIAREIGILGSEISHLKADTEGLIAIRVLERIRSKIDFDLFSSNPEKNWKQISRELRETLAAEVRDESYSLSRYQHTEIKARTLWLDVLRKQKIHLSPMVFALVNLCAGLATFYNDSDNWVSFRQPILNFILSFVILCMFSKFQNNPKLHNPFPKSLFLFSIVATNISTSHLLIEFFPTFYQIAPLFILIPWQIALLYSISSAIELIKFKTDKLVQLESINDDLVDKQRILQNYHQQIRNDISTHLHGFLVSKLHNESLRLDAFAGEKDFVKYDQTLRLLLSEFTLEKMRRGLKRDLIGPDFFEECKKSWDGIVCIEFLGELDVPDRMHETTKLEVTQVIEEIIVNAHRHGGATEVSIDFSWLDEQRLAITARDNGRGIKSGYKKGLGCTLYELASDGEWRIEGTEGIGSTLHLVVTLYDQESSVEAI